MDISSKSRHNILCLRGEGVTLFDLSGKAYLDLTGGFGENSFGYDDPATCGDYLIAPDRYCPKHSDNIARLIRGTGFSNAVITGGGIESLLLALTMIKDSSSKKKHQIIVAGGRSLQLLDSFGGFSIDRINPDFAAVKSALCKGTAALILQPISDSLSPSAYDFFINSYALAKSLDIMFVCDETHIGIGRTGTLYAYEGFGIQPDLVMLGSGLAGGLNAGAVLSRGEMFQSAKFVESKSNTLVSRRLSAVLESLTVETLKDVEEKGAYLLGRLYKFSKHNFVLDIRGKGLAAAIELSGKVMAASVAGRMERAGFLIDYNEANILKITPPLSISKPEIDEAVDALEKIFAETNI